MNFATICSGINAPAVAWNRLNWQESFCAEIEKFPCQVLNHHFPTIPNYGDIERFSGWPVEPLDLLCGGTPCQSFSIAGLRKGLDDPRGNLSLIYLAIAERYQPRWVIWENVPGVLSSWSDETDQKGLATGWEINAFDCFLSGLAELGYGFAYRILDAQYVRTCEHVGAVPQRRRRVFVVGYLGDWRRAAAVLFDAESLRGNPPPRRQPREGITSIPELGAEGSSCAPTLDCHMDSKWGSNQWVDSGFALTLRAQPNSSHRADSQTFIAQALRTNRPGEGGMSGDDTHLIAGSPALNTQSGSHHAPDTKAYIVHGTQDGENVVSGQAVRRLTPLECERLQGFPDGFTDIPIQQGKKAPDGPRYKALGNSMACNVMHWIGQRIAMAETL